MLKTDVPLANIRDLINRYNGAIPRYTSYPTAIEFNERYDENSWREALTQTNFGSKREKNISLYFHLPFCHSLCYFCACNKIIAKDYSGVLPYLETLCLELDYYSELLPSDVVVNQIHWGGGTPNFFRPEEMKKLIEHTTAKFPNVSPCAELSVELDPRTVTEAHLKTLRALGFSRVSLGVQDFNEDVQAAINRLQSFETTKKLFDIARSLGFSGINVDLIYGLPNQTKEKFLETVDKVISLRPDRIALYGYAHVFWIKKAQKALERASIPDSDLRVEIFTAALDAFKAAGYCYIGMDHFSLPEDPLAQSLTQSTLRRNFMGYTVSDSDTVIGLGVSAISSLPTAFAQNSRSIDEYQQRVGNGGLAIERGLARSFDDRVRSEVIESLLCSGEVNFNSFEQKWEIEFKSYFGRELEKLNGFNQDGLIVSSADGLQITDLGRVFSRNIASTFDSYLQGHSGNAKVFSQAV